MGLIELVLVFGIVLGFGGWQLYSLRRERLRDLEREAGRQRPQEGAPGQDDKA